MVKMTIQGWCVFFFLGLVIAGLGHETILFYIFTLAFVITMCMMIVQLIHLLFFD